MRLATSQAGETTVSEYEALAKNVIRRTLHIQPKENVIVETWNHGLPIATEVVYQVRAAGARPMLLFEDEDTYWKSVNTLPDRKSTRLNSSHLGISYAVFCLKKKKKTESNNS